MKKWLLKLLLGGMVTGLNLIVSDPRDVIVLRVDIGNLPKIKADNYMNSIQQNVEKLFKENKVLVLPHSTGLDIINFKKN